MAVILIDSKSKQRVFTEHQSLLTSYKSQRILRSRCASAVKKSVSVFLIDT